MKIFERVMTCLIALSVVLRLLSVPGSVAFSAICFLTLALFYFVFALFLFNEVPIRKAFSKKTYLQIKWKKIIWTIIVGIVFSISVFSWLFALNEWNGVNVILMLGIVLLIPIGITALIKQITRASKYNRIMLIRIVGMLSISALLMFLCNY